MRTLIWYSYFFGYMIFHLPTLIRGKKALKREDYETLKAIVDKNVPKWCNTLIRLAEIQVTVKGKENIPTDTNCVFVANHRGLYDIPIMLTQLGGPYPLLSKIEAKKIPLVRTWMEILRCLFVDRKDPKQGAKCLSQGVQLVKDGYSMSIFPEGTRFKGEEGDMGPFLGGAFRIASKSKRPVVPVVLFGTRACLEGNGRYTIKKGHITVHILPAVETKDMTAAEAKQLPEKIEQIIREDLKKGA